MILEDLGGNPLDVTLDHIVKDLLSFFNGFECLHEAKRMIEKKCAIKKEPEHKCWSEDYIKQAWNETIKEDIKSSTRRHLARVIILQIVKNFVCDTCKQNAAQKNRDATTDEQCCDMRRNPDDRSSQSRAELETVGAAGGVEQMFGARKKVSEVSKLSEDSGAASGSQLSASGTDEAPLPTEVNSSNSETKKATLVIDNADLVDNCEQQKDVEYELGLVDVHDKENVRWKNGLQSTCGKAQSMKVNAKERSTQSSDELKTVGAAGRAEQYSGGNPPINPFVYQSDIASQFWTGTQFQSQVWRQAIGNGDCQSRTLESEENMNRVDETFYIRIPLPLMSVNAPRVTEGNGQNVASRYKLINGFPSDTDLIGTTSYAMSSDNNTGNAEWVYEVLNRNTLVSVFNSSGRRFGNGYDKGHLAAAANHKWCWEAYYDTYLFSNIIPQNHLLNIRTWKTLEERCRKLAKKNEIRNVHVYTGPLYLRPIGLLPHFELEPGRKIVPTHLFKVIIVENMNWTVEEPQCYVTPNERPHNEEWIRMHIGELQTLSGLTFIERRTNLREIDEIMTVTLQGEIPRYQIPRYQIPRNQIPRNQIPRNQIPRNVNIGVRITHNVNW